MSVLVRNPWDVMLALVGAAGLFLMAAAPVGAQLAGQLGVLDVNDDLAFNPETGLPWAAGDTYRLLFLTSVPTDATSASIDDYNAFVQGVAAGSTAFPKLGNGLWKMVGSTVDVDARDNTGTNPATGFGVAVFLLDGVTGVADSNADLWDGTLFAPVDLDENGQVITEDRVFTGSWPDGTAVPADGGDRPLGVPGGAGVQTGSNQQTNGWWIRSWKAPTTDQNSVYALSAPLTVVDLSDVTAPGFVSMVDDQAGGPVAVPQRVVYTVTFDEPMSAGSVGVDDFENATGTPVAIDHVRPTEDPAVYEVAVTTTETGTLSLQIKPGAALADLPGNALDTGAPLRAAITININDDVVVPTVESIADDAGGGRVVAGQSMTPVYTVTFSEPIDVASLGADDFENGGSAPVVVESVNATGNPAVFEVVVTSSGPGELVLQVAAGAEILDLAGNAMDTTAATADDTTIAVEPAPSLKGELGVLDVVNANGGINPATGEAWAEGDTYRMVFVTSAPVRDATSGNMADYHAAVTAFANDAGLPGNWYAVGMTSGTSGQANTDTLDDGVGIFAMDGVTKIADNYVDFWDGSLDQPMSRDETGTEQGDLSPAVGGFANGVAEEDGGRHLGGSTEDPSKVHFGRSTVTDSRWARVFNGPATRQWHFYVMSEVLTVGPGTPRVFPLTIVPNAPTSRFRLEWPSQAGMDYNVRSSADLRGPVDGWTLVEGGIPASGTGTNTYDVDPPDGVLFYVVEEYPTPPVTVYSEDFEGGEPGWTTGANDGDSGSTAWELGAPTAFGPPTANSPANCFGTNLSATYGESSNIWLRTPAGGIDLSGASEATLVFRQWVEMDEFDNADSGTVRILDAAGLPDTVTELAVLQAGITGMNAGWREFRAALPAAVLGRPVVVEFLFVSDNDPTVLAPGWYIDDVVVTAPGS